MIKVLILSVALGVSVMASKCTINNTGGLTPNWVQTK